MNILYELETGIKSIKSQLSIVKGSSQTSDVDDYIVDIYEKLQLLFEIVHKDELYKEAGRFKGPSYRG